MNSGEKQTIWFLYCAPMMSRIRLIFICGDDQFETRVKVRFVRYSLRCEGDLFGRRFMMEANSRRRLSGDTRDATRIQFAGWFEHEDGASGDFTIREREDGELMRLNLYGVTSAIRAMKINSRVVESPVEIYGLGADIDLRLERNTAAYRPAIARKQLPTRPAKPFYAGYCEIESLPFSKQKRESEGPSLEA